ncbi:hypothetical protein BH23VER1_BH23VER1_30590 [soil metagenome]
MRGNPLFALPLDHVLASESLTLLDRKIGPALGSDHNPVAVTIGIAGR